MTQASAHTDRPHGYRRILVPVDGSPPSDRALAEAIAVARPEGAVLRLLAVFDESKYVNGFEPALAVIDEVLPQARRAVDEMLRAGRERALAAGVEADALRVDGGGPDIAALVAAQSLDWPADLVVVGTHGRRGVDRLLMGSVAEQILRACPVPILLVRTPADAAAQPATRP